MTTRAAPMASAVCGSDAGATRSTGSRPRRGWASSSSQRRTASAMSSTRVRNPAVLGRHTAPPPDSTDRRPAVPGRATPVGGSQSPLCAGRHPQPVPPMRDRWMQGPLPAVPVPARAASARSQAHDREAGRVRRPDHATHPRPAPHLPRRPRPRTQSPAQCRARPDRILRQSPQTAATGLDSHETTHHGGSQVRASRNGKRGSHIRW